jgi:hypothetical protein
MFKHNNTPIADWLTINGIQRPQNYWTKENCVAEGVVWEADPVAVPPTAVELAAAFGRYKAQVLLQIDLRNDAVIRAVIGERQSEYELAEREAAAFKVAGYPATPVPGSVGSWAAAKGWTATRAADDILAVASRWRAAQAALRANRLVGKEAVGVAVDGPAIDAIMVQWVAFCTAIEIQLGAR